MQAYSQWIAENGQEPSLPGVNLTDKQLFFLAFAQVRMLQWEINIMLKEINNTGSNDYIKQIATR